jgi:hypothetical protein
MCDPNWQVHSCLTKLCILPFIHLQAGRTAGASECHSGCEGRSGDS